MTTLLPPSVPMSRVELSVSATKLKDKDLGSKSDPLCVLYSKNVSTKALFELARTEQIKDNLNPKWATKFEVDFRFEERQVLEFHVFDWDKNVPDVSKQDKLGYTEISLAEIMANGGSAVNRVLTNGHGASLSISGEEQSQSKEVVTLNFAASGLDKKDTFGKSDPFLIISRASLNGVDYSAVHRTEHILKTLNPVWKPFAIHAKVLCGGDSNRSIKIECFDWDGDGSHDLIGECVTTLQQLKLGNVSSNNYALINPKKKAKKSSYKDSGKLILTSCTTHEEPTFLDYIRGGTQLHFTVAVDFTASNGDPRQPSSLHHWNPNQDNQYEAAIKAVGEIIQDYDSDKQFPALGFGGKVPPEYQVSHEFFLNGRNDTPYCSGVEGVLAAYKHSLGTVGLYGPTNFAPVINHVAQFARSLQEGKNYFVLLIITDGIITDLARTREALVAASALPMSVIIVGVGNEDFSTMEQLDGDDKKLSHNGRTATRDIVQFVELRRFLRSGGVSTAESRAALAESVLKEVPGQLVEYMKWGQRRI